MKKQLVLPIALLGCVVSMQGMLMLQRTGARLSRPSMGSAHRNVPTNSVIFRTENPSQFSTGVQRRLYSSPTPKATGLWGYVSSFFAQNKIPELRNKAVAEVMHELLYPEHEVEVKDMAGIKRQIRSFDENDLEKARDVLGRMIASNEKYKILPVVVGENTSWFRENNRSAKNLRTEESLLSTILFRLYGHGHNTWDRAGSRVIRYGFEGTLLDEVLYKIFSGESATKFYVASASELHYIYLAQWLSEEMGVKINAKNEKGYMLGYECIMREYRDLYRPRSFFRETMHLIDAESFKQIFAALDSVLEKVITSPELKQELYQLQQERREIEANPQAYREKMEEQDRRDAYISKKAYKIEMEYRARTGDWNIGSHVFRETVVFDEAEYEQWKKTGWLHGEREAWEQEQQQLEQQSEFQHYVGDDIAQQRKMRELKNHFGWPSDVSVEMIVGSINNYIKYEHPDKYKSRSDISSEEKERRAKEFGEFMGRYDDVIKKLKEYVKRERQDQQSRE